MRDRPAKHRGALALPAMLHERHLALHNSKDFSAWTTERKELLHRGGAAHQRVIDGTTPTALRQEAMDLWSLERVELLPDKRIRVQRRYRSRLRMTEHDRAAVVSARKQH